MKRYRLSLGGLCSHFVAVVEAESVKDAIASLHVALGTVVNSDHEWYYDIDTGHRSVKMRVCVPDYAIDKEINWQCLGEVRPPVDPNEEIPPHLLAYRLEE